MGSTGPAEDEAASALITRLIEELGDWRGETLARVRAAAANLAARAAQKARRGRS